MLTNQEAKDTILFLRSKGYSISGIHSVTGRKITEICEVIYEQNQKDIASDSTSSGNWDGVF